MDFLRRWRKPAGDGSGGIAKDRLKLVLVHDRLSIAAPQLDSLKSDLVAVLSRYFDFDQSSLMVDVRRGDQRNQLITTISVRREM
jgi:cell division topological specificity factor